MKVTAFRSNPPLLRFLHIHVPESYAVNVGEGASKICRIQGCWRCQQDAHQQVGGVRCESSSAPPRPPIIKSANNSDIIDERVHNSELRFLGGKPISLDDWHELLSTGGYSGRREEECEDGGVV